MRTPVINLKSGCVAQSQCTATLFLKLLQALWVIVQAMNSIRNAPASIALTQVLHWSHNAHTTNHHLCAKVERNGTQRRTKVSFDKTMMQVLELLWLAKRHILGLSNAEQWRNQAIATSILILKGSRDLNDKKLWNKFLVARANGITT